MVALRIADLGHETGPGTIAMGEGPRAAACPACGAHEMVMIENCLTCRACGQSKCS
ncbi:MAG: hypothetical protein ACXIUV_11570 [Alkalilacustris sp.]